MKRKTLERWMLLEQTGELSLLARWLLARELKKDPAARRYQQDMMRMTTYYRDRDESRNVADSSIAAIMAAAKEKAEEPEERVYQPTVTPSFSWQPALVYAAAALAILLTGWFVLKNNLSEPSNPIAQESKPEAIPDQKLAAQYQWDDSIDNDIDNLESMLVMASYEWAENEETAPDISEDIDTDEIANELLNIQGSNI